MGGPQAFPSKQASQQVSPERPSPTLTASARPRCAMSRWRRLTGTTAHLFRPPKRTLKGENRHHPGRPKRGRACRSGRLPALPNR